MPTHIVGTPLFLLWCVDNLNVLGFIVCLDKGEGEKCKIEQNWSKISLFSVNFTLSFFHFLNQNRPIGFSIYREVPMKTGFWPLEEYFKGLLELKNLIFNFYVQFLKNLTFSLLFFLVHSYFSMLLTKKSSKKS